MIEVETSPTRRDRLCHLCSRLRPCIVVYTKAVRPRTNQTRRSSVTASGAPRACWWSFPHLLPRAPGRRHDDGRADEHLGSTRSTATRTRTRSRTRRLALSARLPGLHRHRRGGRRHHPGLGARCVTRGVRRHQPTGRMPCLPSHQYRSRGPRRHADTHADTCRSSRTPASTPDRSPGACRGQACAVSSTSGDCPPQ